MNFFLIFQASLKCVNLSFFIQDFFLVLRLICSLSGMVHCNTLLYPLGFFWLLFCLICLDCRWYFVRFIKLWSISLAKCHIHSGTSGRDHFELVCVWHVSNTKAGSIIKKMMNKSKKKLPETLENKLNKVSYYHKGKRSN